MQLNNYLTRFLCFILVFFATFITKAQNTLQDSSVIIVPKQAVMYVTDGTTIYGNENVGYGKIVLLKNNSKKSNEGKLVSKSSKPKKEKLLKSISKEPKKYAKIKSDEAVYDPFSPESSSHFNQSKNSNSVASNNTVQQFSKFQKTAIFSIIVGKKIISKATIFSYSQTQNTSNFSEIFSVRPPPIS